VMDDPLLNRLASDQAAMQRPLVQTEALTIRFGRQVILNNISLSIARGETVAIIGESGCGKTLFLKSLAGLIPATSGRILFDGMDIYSMSESGLALFFRTQRSSTV